IGSADLTGSNLTRWKTAVDFQPESTNVGNYSGRYLRYGVREHGMAAIMNGLDAYGGIIPGGATFLNFISYASGKFPSVDAYCPLFFFICDARREIPNNYVLILHYIRCRSSVCPVWTPRSL